MVQDLLQKEKLSRHMSLSHEEEKTQNKYKLVLCVDNYNGGERGRERTKILYVYTQRKKKILGGSQCYPFGQGCVCY